MEEYPQLNYVKLPNGEYQLSLGDQVLFTTPAVAVLYDSASGTVMKHGPVSVVKSNYVQMVLAYRQHGGPVAINAANALEIIEDDFDVEELNKIVGICDYIQLYVKTRR